MDIPHVFNSESAQETQRIGEEFAHEIAKSSSQQSAVICLYGELGSGKTTFAQGFARGLGYHRRLLSPTFIIMRTYDLDSGRWFYHLDLYRIYTEHELDSLGIREIFSDPKSIIVIEWAEKIHHLLPKARWEIQCTTESDQIRKIEVYQHS